MPTSSGYNSVGLIAQFDPVSAANIIAHGYAYQLYPVTYPRLVSDPFHPTFMFTALGNLAGAYILNDSSFSPPAFHNYPAGASTGGDLSTAQVAGVCYILAPGSGVFHLNNVTATIPDVLTGIVAANLKGILSSNGLMIGWTDTGIFWSSNQDPLDFTPSLVTGAGGGNIGEVKGTIKYCSAIAGGFLIYASDNIVQANYTGNVAFPFKFNEVAGSGGIIDQRDITYQDNSATQFALTQKGIQAISIGAQSTNILAQITEFLYSGYYEDFDPITGIFTQILIDPSTPQDNHTINFIGGRYLVFSYGLILTTVGGNSAKEYKYALILDTLENRIGKIKFNHVDTMFFNLSQVFVNVPLNAGTRIGFLTKEGAMYTIDSALNSKITTNDNTGIILIGKFQMQRNRGVYHQRTKIEATYQGAGIAPTVTIMPTLNGKTFLPPVALSLLNTPIPGDGYRIFGRRVYGLNISILIAGPFNLSSVQTDLVLGAQDMRYS